MQLHFYENYRFSVVSVAPTQKRGRDNSGPGEPETENKKARVAEPEPEPEPTTQQLNRPQTSQTAPAPGQVDDDFIVVLVGSARNYVAMTKNLSSACFPC